MLMRVLYANEKGLISVNIAVYYIDGLEGEGGRWEGVNGMGGGMIKSSKKSSTEHPADITTYVVMKKHFFKFSEKF